MSWLSYEEIATLREPAFRRGRGVRGMGMPIAEVIAGIVGPIASAGSTAYATYAQQDLAKKDLKARQSEITSVLAQREREAQLQAQADREAAVGRQGRSFLSQQNVELAIAVAGTGAALWGASKILSAAIQWRASRGR